MKYIVEARTKKDNIVKIELPAMTKKELENDVFYNRLKTDNEYTLTLKPNSYKKIALMMKTAAAKLKQQQENKKLFNEGRKITLSSFDASRVNLSLLEEKTILIVWSISRDELERIDLSSEKLDEIKKELKELSEPKNVSEVSDSDLDLSAKDWLKKHDVDKTSWNE